MDVRRRGTAIVETEEGILVASGRRKTFLLPGGGAEHNETRLQAAIRELFEETGLRTYSCKFLFRHVGIINKRHNYQDHHTVCLIEATGKAKPCEEIKYIAYYMPGCEIKLSQDTKDIIERYYAYKRKRPQE